MLDIPEDIIRIFIKEIPRKVISRHLPRQLKYAENAAFDDDCWEVLKQIKEIRTMRKNWLTMA